MTAPRVFQATASKQGKWWNITIPELGQASATKKLTEVQEYANSLAAATLDVQETDVDVRVTFTLPAAVESEWTAAREETRRAKELTIAAASRTKRVVKQLHAQGYTIRDIAQVLGISFQRASQILNS